jgi:GMP synthase (glutamine-hydrolysing)
VIDMSERVAFFAGVTDAQFKRKNVFQKEIYVPGTVGVVRRVAATQFLQGSLVPDFIESGATGGEMIKTHHNIGIDVGVPQLHPLSTLFKYEVRVLARELGLPESVSERKPFPGPGLFIRIVGIPVSNPILDCLRSSTYEVERILQSDQRFWREEVSQPVVGYFGTSTVGQKGDNRVYSGSIVTRVVKTLDYMTAEGVEIPSEMRREIKRVVTKHPLVVRALFDETDKPPGTTEFE